MHAVSRIEREVAHWRISHDLGRTRMLEVHQVMRVSTRWAWTWTFVLVVVWFVGKEEGDVVQRGVEKA